MINIGAMQPQILSNNEAAPFIPGMKAGQDFANSILQAQQENAKAMVAPQMAQQGLAEAIYKNKLLGAQAGLAPQFAQAELQTQQMAPYTQAGPANIAQLQLLAQQGSTSAQSILGGMQNGSGGLDPHTTPAAIYNTLGTTSNVAQQQATGGLNAQGNQQAQQGAYNEFTTATRGLNYLDALDNDYKNTSFVGPAASKFPVGTSPSAVQGLIASGLNKNDVTNAQAFDTNMNNLINTVTSLQPILGSHESNLIIHQIAAAKPNRSLTPDAYNQISTEIRAALERAQEEGNYKQQFIGSGGNYNDANLNFTRYQSDNPLIDPKTGKVNQYNLGDSAAYLPGGSKYMTPSQQAAIQKQIGMTGSQINQLKAMPGAIGTENNMPTKANTPNGPYPPVDQGQVLYIDKNGKPWPVDRSRINEAMQRSPGGKVIG